MTISKTYLKRLKKCTKEVQLTKKRLYFACKQQKCKKKCKIFFKKCLQTHLFMILYIKINKS